MDPVTTQATAKAVEETAKTAGKIVELADNVGGYLNRVFGDLLHAAVGLAGGNWLIYSEKLNVDAWRRRTEQIMRERDVKEFIELTPNQAKELLLAAQDESRPELAELWARLLANAMDPKLNNVRYSFIEALKLMDPADAVILKFIYERDISMAQQPTLFEQMSESSGYQYRPDEITVSLDHLQSLGFFDRRGAGFYYVTANNREFMRACYPEITKSGQ
jgi:hypothetical protein